MEYTLDNLDALPRQYIEITPKAYSGKAMDIARCRQVASASQVRARGWHFPHIDRNGMIVGKNNAYVGNEIDGAVLTDHIERWRLYPSGHFLFTAKLWEVPAPEIQEVMRKNQFPSSRKGNIKGFVSFVGQIYMVAEAYAFASRLAQGVPFEGPIRISVGLRNVKSWCLGSTEFGVDLEEFITNIDGPEDSRDVPLEDLVADPLQQAVTATVGLFQQFNWFDPSRGMIENWQRQIFK